MLWSNATYFQRFHWGFRPAAIVSIDEIVLASKWQGNAWSKTFDFKSDRSAYTLSHTHAHTQTRIQRERELIHITLAYSFWREPILLLLLLLLLLPLAHMSNQFRQWHLHHIWRLFKFIVIIMTIYIYLSPNHVLSAWDLAEYHRPGG